MPKIFNPLIFSGFDEAGSAGAGTVTSVAGGVGITNTPDPIVGAGTVDLDIDSLTTGADPIAVGDLFPFVDVSIGVDPTSQRKVSFANLQSAISFPVVSVFGRTGAVIAAANDYTWGQIDKTLSDLADITTRPHSALTSIGANDHHNQIHAIDGLDHTGSLAHSALSGIGANDHHNQIHAIDGLDHTGSLAHSALSGIGVNDHHNQAHVLATNLALGPDHSISGCAAGQVLRASGAAAANFQALVAGDLPINVAYLDAIQTWTAVQSFQANIGKINNVSYIFPAVQGLANTYLKNDGAGNLSWAVAGGGGGAPGGPDRSIQFNNAGAFDGSANLLFTAAGYLALGVGGTAATPAFYLGGDVDTGLYSTPLSNSLRISCGGVVAAVFATASASLYVSGTSRFSCTPAYNFCNNPLNLIDGAVGGLCVRWNNDINTGFYRIGDYAFAMVCGGYEVARFAAFGFTDTTFAVPAGSDPAYPEIYFRGSGWPPVGIFGSPGHFYVGLNGSTQVDFAVSKYRFGTYLYCPINAGIGVAMDYSADLGAWGSADNNLLCGRLILFKSRGAASSRTPVVGGDHLGQILFRGWQATTLEDHRNGARIHAQAAEYWDSTHHGTKLFFGTTPNATFASDPPINMCLDQTGYLGVGINAGVGWFPDARVEVQTETTEGKQAATIDQNDEDEAFIDFQGTSAADLTKNITSLSVPVITGHFLVEINGAKKWVPYSDTPV